MPPTTRSGTASGTSAVPADTGFLVRATARVRRRLGRRDRVAFVLSGGGNLGAVQVGMLRALAEAGVVPDVIVGCSVGAINGAGFAAEPSLAGVDRLDRIWRRIAEGDPDLMPSKRLPVLAQMARRGDALHEQDRLADLLDDELPTKTFDGLRVPFACVATDLETASEHWFESGRLVPALLASAALPVVYPAVEYDDRVLIDGGVGNEVHATKAVALGATELYILHVGHLEGREVDVQRPFDGAVRAYWTARRFRLEDDLRRIPDHCIVHRLPAGSSPRLRFDDFTQAEELTDLAHRATAQYLRTGRSPVPVSGPVSPPQFEPDDRWPSEADAPPATGTELALETGSGPEPDQPPVESRPDSGRTGAGRTLLRGADRRRSR